MIAGSRSQAADSHQTAGSGQGGQTATSIRKGYWLYTSNPYDNERRREAFERHGFEQGLEILARSFKEDHETRLESSSLLCGSLCVRYWPVGGRRPRRPGEPLDYPPRTPTEAPPQDRRAPGSWLYSESDVILR